MENTVTNNTDASALSAGLLDSDEIEISCSFVKLIFSNKESGYTVVEYASCDFDENGAIIGNFVASGHFLSCNDDATIILRGKWGEHYNKRSQTKEMQFFVSSYDLELPSTDAAIISYLTSIKGCGQATAEKIVAKFGDKTYEVLESEDAIEQLMSLPRVSRAKAEAIIEAFSQEYNVVSRTVLTKCLTLGISPNKSQKLFAQYGEDTINVLTSTPYRIIEIDGFGFIVADKIARSTVFRGEPFDVDSLVRIKAGVLFALKSELSNGNLYLDDDELCKAASVVLEIYNNDVLEYSPTREVLMDAIRSLINNSEIKQYVFENTNFNIKKNYNYLPFSLKAEKKVAKFVCDRLKNRKKLPESNDELKEVVIESASELKFSPSEKQVYAAMRVLKNNFSIITGGPGCGKTTIIKMVIRAFQKLWDKRKNETDDEIGENPMIQLAAPTGRAARRMTESCGFPASTIHFLLGLKPNESLSSSELNYIESDLLIVDEFSMVDSFVAAHLVSNISSKTKVVFVGDAAQLPSVGPGSVFSELIASGCVPTTTLTEIFRQQSDAGLIVENAARVRSGYHHLDHDMSFQIVRLNNNADAQKFLCNIFESELVSAGQNASDKVQVLTPRRTDVPTSVEVLNPLLKEISQRVLYPGSDERLTFTVCGTEYCIGDKIMQLKNTEDAANGDIGYIVDINEQDGALVAKINFGDHILEYTKKDMENIIHAYACTIHKSQGAEFDTVIIPILPEHGIMLERALFYTAITRAIKRVIVITTTGNYCLKRAVETIKGLNRNTLLSYFIGELVKVAFNLA